MSKKIFLASPRGYCAGVDRAIGMLEDIIEVYGAPIYVNHEIVHNKFIVSYFERK
jgi:4-hydroxy-3-methylbut-2-enyl diphosphate reductase